MDEHVTLRNSQGQIGSISAFIKTLDLSIGNNFGLSIGNTFGRSIITILLTEEQFFRDQGGCLSIILSWCQARRSARSSSDGFQSSTEHSIPGRTDQVERKKQSPRRHPAVHFFGISCIYGPIVCCNVYWMYILCCVKLHV